jgi:DNA gyrase/topoisomerase IV subunit B
LTDGIITTRSLLHATKFEEDSTAYCQWVSPRIWSSGASVNSPCSIFSVGRLSAKLGGKPEITRFKGLGEISPNEFKQFIGKEMRLSQVEYAPKVDSQQILSFYMGKNTPERKDYIMENLVVTVEE